MKNHPKVTIGFLSWNRLHYLRATLESAKACIEYPEIEWIVSDNESEEPGLREYIESLNWVDTKLFRRQSHADAMNELVDIASGEYILIWPEDVQFVVKGDWMVDMVEILDQHRDIGSLCLDFPRKASIHDIFQPSILQHKDRFLDEIWRYGIKFRRPKTYTSSRGLPFSTLGWTKPGICGSGIPSLTRTDLWKKLGPWQMRGSRAQVGLIDSSLGAEEDMIQRFFASRMPIQEAIPHIPVAADIITDPLGCKAKVRGQFRYGVYMPPPSGTFYYKIRPYAELQHETSNKPMTFDQGVIADGFTIPIDDNGDRLKASFNTSVVYDILNNKPVPYPLVTQKESN